MAANTAPIFARVGNIGIVDSVSVDAVKTANTTKDLTAGTVYLVHTADATNGDFIDKLIIQAKGSNVATVMRVWLNNGSDPTAATTNNALIKDLTLAATTNSEVAAIGNTELLLGIALPAGWKIYVTIGTSVAAGFHVTAISGKY